MKQRYDEHGNYDEHGRYDKSGNFVYTWSERRIALVIGFTLAALAHLLGPVLDGLLPSGVIKFIFGFATLGALWIAVIGRAHPDPD